MTFFMPYEAALAYASAINTCNDREAVEAMLTRTLTPTAEQSAIIDAAKSTKDSILISALAGAAKTSTLEMICACAAGAANSVLGLQQTHSQEMKERLPGHVSVKTLNALGSWYLGGSYRQTPCCQHEEILRTLERKSRCPPAPATPRRLRHVQRNAQGHRASESRGLYSQRKVSRALDALSSQ
jgi:hypothetical protein